MGNNGKIIKPLRRILRKLLVSSSSRTHQWWPSKYYNQGNKWFLIAYLSLITICRDMQRASTVIYSHFFLSWFSQLSLNLLCALFISFLNFFTFSMWLIGYLWPTLTTLYSPCVTRAERGGDIQSGVLDPLAAREGWGRRHHHQTKPINGKRSLRSSPLLECGIINGLILNNTLILRERNNELEGGCINFSLPHGHFTLQFIHRLQH